MTQKQRKMRKKGKRRFATAVIILALLLTISFLVFNYIRIDSVTIIGSEQYSDEELEDKLFSDKWAYHSLYAYFKFNWQEEVEIPFVETYEVSFKDLNTVEIVVYEKSIVGYVEYMGSNMYFDKDGIVVESSKEVLEGIPQIVGLSFNEIALYKALPVKDSSIFTEVMNLAKLLSKYDLAVDKIYYDASLNATLYIGDIKVLLGDNTYLQEKISVLNDMLPNLSELKGSLNLVNYDPTSSDPTPFKPD